MADKSFEWFNLTVYEIYVWWQDKGVGGQGWFYTAFGRHGKPHDELAAGRIEGCESDDLDGAIERTIWELGGVLNPDMFARDPVIGCAFWTRSESTPGPWRLDGDDFKHAGPRYHRIAAGHGYSDPNPDKISRGFGLTGVISYPDALLMASAPDLLTALAALLDFTIELLPGDSEQWPETVQKAIETVSNATTPESRQALLS